MTDMFDQKQFAVGEKFRGRGDKICPECNEKFVLNISHDDYPNRENEFVWCPHCKEIVGHIRTSGIVNTYKD